MTEYTGSALYVAFKGTSLAVDFREFSEDEEIGTVDASAGSDVSRTYLTTLEDGTATLSLVAQAGETAATDPWYLMDKGAEGSLEWGPEGTASNKPRHYVNAIVTSRGKSIPYDDVVEMSFGFQFSGTVTDAQYA
jgi:hypothetical protein